MDVKSRLLRICGKYQNRMCKSIHFLPPSYLAAKLGLYSKFQHKCIVYNQVSRFKPICSMTETKSEYWNYACNKFSYYTFQTVNNKGTDQTMLMQSLVCVDAKAGLCSCTGWSVLCYSHETKSGFLVMRPSLYNKHQKVGIVQQWCFSRWMDDQRRFHCWGVSKFISCNCNFCIADEL